MLFSCYFQFQRTDTISGKGKQKAKSYLKTELEKVEYHLISPKSKPIRGRKRKKKRRKHISKITSLPKTQGLRRSLLERSNEPLSKEYVELNQLEVQESRVNRLYGPFSSQTLNMKRAEPSTSGCETVNENLSDIGKRTLSMTCNPGFSCHEFVHQDHSKLEKLEEDDDTELEPLPEEDESETDHISKTASTSYVHKEKSDSS